MTEQRFDAKDFTGIVNLKHYTIMPDGKQYIAIAGQVSALSDKEVVGFEVKGGDTANWILRVDGPSSSVNILGCQVKLVHQYDGGLPDNLDSSVYVVP